MKDLLTQNDCGHIKIFGGGGGTILPVEIDELHHYGITRIYSPDDGRHMGLEGMIQDVIDTCKAAIPEYKKYQFSKNGHFALNEKKDIKRIARAITLAENGESVEEHLQLLQHKHKQGGHVIPCLLYTSRCV